MNFKLSRFVNLTISLIIGGFFFISGIFAFLLPWSPRLQSAITRLILDSTLILSLFGLGFALIGFSLILYTVLQTRHRYTQIRVGHFSIAIDEKVIYQYVELYWQKHFSSIEVPFNLNFKKHEIEIIVELPPLPLSEQKKFLEQIKFDFTDLFGRVIGYPYDIQLIASFKDR